MTKGTAGVRWRRPLTLLIVTSGATLAWTKARRRRLPGTMPHSWSELDPAASVSLRSVVPEPVATEPESSLTAAGPEPVAPEPVSGSAEPLADTPALDERAASTDLDPVPELSSGHAPETGPYPGSVLPLDDGSPPSDEYVIKGNAGSMRSHSPDSPYFGRTRAEVWFRTQEDAVDAGFEPWTPKR